ncbi:MAG: hypothetical protein AVDCRST_MAG76-1748, partial [uncultured Acidimicrobiales bacterium]
EPGLTGRGRARAVARGPAPGRLRGDARHLRGARLLPQERRAELDRRAAGPAHRPLPGAPAPSITSVDPSRM